MNQQFFDDFGGLPLSKFEFMLKTNSVYFFDANEFEEIILYYIDNGKFSLANKAVQLGLRQHPLSVDLKLVQAELLVLEEKFENAEKILNELQEIEPANEDIYIQKATIYSKKGVHKKAIAYLKIALEYSEEPSEIYSMIGMEYLYLDEFEMARENFAMCLDVEFDNYSTLYNVIYCFDMTEQHAEAVEYLISYIEKDPYSEVAWHQLGRQYFVLENYSKALEAFEYAILIDDTFIGAHLEKAKTLEELNRLEEAIEYYGLTMELDTETPFAFLRIGKCYEGLGDLDKAIEFYHKTVNEDPLLDKGWLALTDIYMKKGMLDKAMHHIKKALNIDEE
ncbi:MAG: tetratricopeptide repeat protein, partial [Lutimonas sp.]